MLFKKYERFFTLSVFFLILKFCYVSSDELCGNSICSKPGGKCKEGEKCICSSCYTNKIETNNHLLCNYQQKSSTKGFVLELFFPFGIGHFYLGNTFKGLIKLLLIYFFTSCIYFLVIGFIGALRHTNCNYVNIEIFNNEPNLVHYIKRRIEFIILIILITDLLCFYMNVYSDGNGMPLC